MRYTSQGAMDAQDIQETRRDMDLDITEEDGVEDWTADPDYWTSASQYQAEEDVTKEEE